MTFFNIVHTPAEIERYFVSVTSVFLYQIHTNVV